MSSELKVDHFLVVFLMFVSLGCNYVISVGVNWGTIATHHLPSKSVVKMLEINGFDKVKFFETDYRILWTLLGSDIEVTLGIPNYMLAELSQNPAAAEKWVDANVTDWCYDGGVNIRYVAVGNEPFLQEYNGAYVPVLLPALINIQSALNRANLNHHIRVTVPFNSDIYNSPEINPIPSSGNFRPNIRDSILEILHFLHNNNAHFTVNIYPFFSLHSDPHFPIEYVFFENTVNRPLVDGDKMYTNAFDASYDTLVSALEKAGYDDMEVVVGEVGWPTDGDVAANPRNAKRFTQGLLNHVLGGEGTPKRKGRKMEIFLFSLFDEDEKSIIPGEFERHWGIFGYDGKPKYPLHISGHNELIRVQGVHYLSRQWCILNPTASNYSDVPGIVNNICKVSDCSPLSYGCSCGHLSNAHKASYAMNVYYQKNNQQYWDCDYSGLGMLTKDDPSDEECKFPVMITSDHSLRTSRGHVGGYLLLFLLYLCVYFLFISCEILYY